MNFKQRKATTAKTWHLKYSFLEDVATTVSMEGIPAELMLNWNQTGIKIVPSSTWTMSTRGSQRVEIAGVNDKRQITAVFCGFILGDYLPIQLIYPGKTIRCHPPPPPPPPPPVFSFRWTGTSWHITHTYSKALINEATMIDYMALVKIGQITPAIK